MNDKEKKGIVKVSLEGVRIEYPSQKPIILLKEENGDRYLPIWIGTFEASAIALELSNIKTPRPMTHDLLVNMLQDLNIIVNKITISDIIDNTFYAVISLKDKDNKSIDIDSRPSDAIAIAVRQNCNIFTSEHVLENAGLRIQTIDEEIEKFKEFLDNVGPEDFE
jgi:uncharacterized protein